MSEQQQQPYYLLETAGGELSEDGEVALVQLTDSQGAQARLGMPDNQLARLTGMLLRMQSAIAQNRKKPKPTEEMYPLEPIRALALGLGQDPKTGQPLLMVHVGAMVLPLAVEPVALRELGAMIKKNVKLPTAPH